MKINHNHTISLWCQHYIFLGELWHAQNLLSNLAHFSPSRDPHVTFVLKPLLPKLCQLPEFSGDIKVAGFDLRSHAQFEMPAAEMSSPPVVPWEPGEWKHHQDCVKLESRGRGSRSLSLQAPWVWFLVPPTLSRSMQWPWGQATTSVYFPRLSLAVGVGQRGENCREKVASFVRGGKGGYFC